MKKIIRLTESDLASIVKRIIKESNPQNVNFDDLIGKTVKFTPIPSSTLYIKDDGSEYSQESFDIEPLGKISDKQTWENMSDDEPIKGKIKDMRILSNGEVVFISLTDLEGHDFLRYEAITYECGSEEFEIEFHRSKNPNSFFDGGKFVIYATNKKLSENLENRLPCGNFDFAMNKSNNNDFA